MFTYPPHRRKVASSTPRRALMSLDAKTQKLRNLRLAREASDKTHRNQASAARRAHAEAILNDLGQRARHRGFRWTH